MAFTFKDVPTLNVCLEKAEAILFEAEESLAANPTDANRKAWAVANARVERILNALAAIR